MHGHRAYIHGIPAWWWPMINVHKSQGFAAACNVWCRLKSDDSCSKSCRISFLNHYKAFASFDVTENICTQKADNTRHRRFILRQRARISTILWKTKCFHHDLAPKGPHTKHPGSGTRLPKTWICALRTGTFHDLDQWWIFDALPCDTAQRFVFCLMMRHLGTEDVKAQSLEGANPGFWQGKKTFKSGGSLRGPI